MSHVRIFCFLSISFGTLLSLQNVEAKSLTPIRNPYHSDVIVTHWPTPTPGKKIADSDADQPGFMRRQLIKFGEMASNVGNVMGAHATKITAAIDKICEVIKTIIPVLAAVCHVGQFKFCEAATDAPEKLAQAMNPASSDLNILD